MKIAFIGLGDMGLPMALNLARAGIEVVGFDVDVIRLARFDGPGRIASSVTDAVKGVDAVFTVLPADPHVRSVAAEVAEAAEGTRWFVDFTTMAGSTMEEVAVDLQRVGIESISVTLTRGTAAAASGDLGLFLGGPAALPPELAPAFSAMAGDVYPVGGLAAAKTFKLANNMAVMTLGAMTCELATLGEIVGVGPATLTAALSANGVDSWPTRNLFGQIVAARNPSASSFATRYAIKDLYLAVSLAEVQDVPVPLAGAALACFRGTAGVGYGEQSYFNLVRWFETGAGHPRPVDVGAVEGTPQELDALVAAARALQRLVSLEALQLAEAAGMPWEVSASGFQNASAANTGLAWWVEAGREGALRSSRVGELSADLSGALDLAHRQDVPATLLEAARHRAISLRAVGTGHPGV